MKPDTQMDAAGGFRADNTQRIPADVAALARHGTQELSEYDDLAPLQLARPAPAPVLFGACSGERAERVRALRTELLLRREDNGVAQSLVLLSPGRREGRSLLAADLAMSFAQLGRPTLLVDADLRHPTQHQLFRTLNGSGLTQAIIDNAPPRLHPIIGLPQLFVLTAGALTGNPLELLLQTRFIDLVDQWRRRFDFVLFDTPPVHQYSDGLALAAIAGDVLTLARAQRTPYQETSRLLQRLAATQARVVGAVISRF